MRRVALVLRPEPGARDTLARLHALGVRATSEPLFAVSPVAWTPPNPCDHDALLLTSANAVRHAGAGLRSLVHLPVLAVGEATAAAAVAAGLRVALTGAADAASLVAAAHARGHGRLVHLAGRDRVTLPGVVQLTVYASNPLPITADTVRNWAGRIALLHSARAAQRFAALIAQHEVARGAVAVAALSDAVARAAGDGWAIRVAAARPDDAVLTTLARDLIDRWTPGADKLPA